MIATERKSTLAVKLEMTNLAGTAASSGTTVTGTGTAFDTALEVGDVIGTLSNGFRTVTAIASATSLTVDSAYSIAITAGTTLKKQTFGTDPTIASSDVVEFVDFTFEPERGEITRDVKRRTFDEIEPVLGAETVSGNVQIELHGSGTAGVAPESDPLWLCAFGERLTTTASAVDGTATTTVIPVTAGDGAKFKAGMHIMVDVGGGVYEVARITSVSTDDLTVSPAFSAAPADTTVISAGIHYSTSLSELPSVWTQFWRGDITLEKYKGNKCSSLSIPFNTNEAVNPTFAFQGKETAEPTSGSYALGTPSYDSGNVHVARYMAVKIGGTTYPVSNVSFELANELYRRTDVTTSGTRDIIRTKRNVTGSFSLLYEDAAVETAFRNGTTAELIMVSSEGDTALTVGNTFAVSLPKIKYTRIPKSKDSGLFKYDVSFKGVLTSGEDVIYASML